MRQYPGLFAVYDDHVVNGYGTEGGFVVELLAGDGSPVADLPPLCHFALVTTPHRDRIAWLGDEASSPSRPTAAWTPDR